MSDPDTLYLLPPCSDAGEGRMYCEDPIKCSDFAGPHDDCECGGKGREPTRYVRADDYERNLHDGHQDRSQDTDWLRAAFLQRGAEIERLEDAVRVLADRLDKDAKAADEQRHVYGAYYEGRSDALDECAVRLRRLLIPR